jgi:hypothetical protein
MIQEVTMYSSGEKANIFDFSTRDIEIIIRISKQIIVDGKNPDDVPWITNIYFVGATMCIDGFFNGKIDTLTVSYNKESVGFFSGGLRRLLSLDALRDLAAIMNELKITKENKV